jgi:MFS family permease
MRSPRLALVVLCTAQFVDVLDVNAVLVALPSVGRDLGLRGGGLQWVVTAYVVAFGGCLLPAGRLADAVGRRRVFAAGIGLFTAASAACAAAPGAPVLVAARAAQGLGAALTAPAALALIVDGFPAGRARERAVAAWTAVAALGGAAGVVAGGLVAGTLGWRWVFAINLPIGLATLALTTTVLPEDQGRTPGWPRVACRSRRLALRRLAVAGAGRRCAPRRLGVAAVAAAWPLVPAAVLRRRPVLVAAGVAVALTATTSGGSVLATLRLQDALGLSPQGASLALLPLSLAVIGGSVLASRIRAPARAVIAAGLLLVGAGSVAAAAGAGAAAVVAWAVLAGLGLGAASVAATTLGASAVPEAQRGSASALLNAAAQLGTAAGVPALVLAGDRPGFAAAAALAVLAAGVGTRAAGNPARDGLTGRGAAQPAAGQGRQVQ